MDIDIRPVREGETQAFRNAIARGFGGDSREEDHDRFYEMLPLHRTLAAFDAAAIVGTLGEFDFELTMPGGAPLAMAGTTVVTVRATHRRRGVLREMMRLHLEAAHERGDPLAGLWASETSIYGRFGFGLAADSHELDIDARQVNLPPGPPDVRVDLVESDEASRVIPAVYAQLHRRRAGSLSRAAAWWEHRRFYDPEHYRDRASGRRYAIARRSGDDVGYVMFRQKEKWSDSIPDGKIDVIEVLSADEGSRRALWSFLTNIDLFPNVNWWNAPVDEPMVWEASNRRQIRRRPSDTLWLRILDVPAVLSTRSYEVDGDVVVQVGDAAGGFANGSYHLNVEGGVASCARSDRPPELTMDVEQLGALCLGGVSAHQLWRAGLIGGEAAAVVAADRLFRTTEAPWCPEVF